MRVIDIKSTQNKIKGNSRYKEVQLLLDNGEWVGCEAIIIDLGIFNEIKNTVYGDSLNKILNIVTDIYIKHIKSRVLNVTEPIYSIVCIADLINIGIEDYIIRQNTLSSMVVPEYVNKIILGDLASYRAATSGKENLILFDEIILPDGIKLEIEENEYGSMAGSIDLRVYTKRITNLEKIGEISGNLGLLRRFGANIPKRLEFKNIELITLKDEQLEELRVDSNCKLIALRIFECYSLRKIELPQLNLDDTLLYLADISPECVIYTPTIPRTLQKSLTQTIKFEPINIVETHKEY